MNFITDHCSEFFLPLSTKRIEININETQNTIPYMTDPVFPGTKLITIPYIIKIKPQKVDCGLTISLLLETFRLPFIKTNNPININAICTMVLLISFINYLIYLSFCSHPSDIITHQFTDGNTQYKHRNRFFENRGDYNNG